jgi:hypothetical protein
MLIPTEELDSEKIIKYKKEVRGSQSMSGNAREKFSQKGT